jgi:L-serine kinase (ADP)
MTGLDHVLLPPTLIRPTEEICPDRVGEVVEMVLERQAWTRPICIEGSVLALLDGHHRLAAARVLGLARVPVHIFDYADVALASWRPDVVPTRTEVLARALSGELYPHKTTRHAFPDRPMRPVPLAALVEGRVRTVEAARQRRLHPGMTTRQSGPAEPARPRRKRI